MALVRRISTPFAAAAILTLLGSLALGGGGNALKLEYVLSGPPIFGEVPSGKATIDQPRLPGTLTCEVQDVNLPDGTSLIVSVGGYRAGTLNLSGGGAKMQTTIPFQVRTGTFEILFGDMTIMTGRWKN
jgi:hypothetical protein